MDIAPAEGVEAAPARLTRNPGVDDLPLSSMLRGIDEIRDLSLGRHGIQ